MKNDDAKQYYYWAHLAALGLSSTNALYIRNAKPKENKYTVSYLVYSFTSPRAVNHFIAHKRHGNFPSRTKIISTAIISTDLPNAPLFAKLHTGPDDRERRNFRAHAHLC